MFYWDTGYVKLILFVNFGDSGVEFRNFVYGKCRNLLADKKKGNKYLRIWIMKVLQKHCNEKSS